MRGKYVPRVDILLTFDAKELKIIFRGTWNVYLIVVVVVVRVMLLACRAGGGDLPETSDLL